MLAIAAITLGLAVPAMADDHAEGHAMTTEAVVETTTEAVVADVCTNDEGVEVECPGVEMEAEVEAEAHDDVEHHDAQ